MPSEMECDQAIEKLIAMTDSREIKWMENPFIEGKRDDVVGKVYATLMDNRYLAVYEYQYKVYDEPESFEWQREVQIEFVSPGDYESDWQWPQTAHRWALLNTVRCHVSGAADILQKLLKKP